MLFQLTIECLKQNETVRDEIEESRENFCFVLLALLASYYKCNSVERARQRLGKKWWLSFLTTSVYRELMIIWATDNMLDFVNDQPLKKPVWTVLPQEL